MGRIWRVSSLVAVFVLASLSGAQAGDKVIDGGKAEKFKGKSFDIKADGKVAIALTFPAGKTATITVRSKRKSDINLFIYDTDKKEVAKDDSPGPSCDIEFTPKEAGKYVLEIVNKGPGDNKSTLKVSFKKKGKG
jgi:hypothetical protein